MTCVEFPALSMYLAHERYYITVCTKQINEQRSVKTGDILKGVQILNSFSRYIGYHKMMYSHFINKGICL